MDILTTQQGGLYETLTPIQFHNLYLKLLALFENGNLTIDDEHYLSGAIKVDRAYLYAVQFLEGHYKDYGLSILHVHEADPFYEFEDPNTQFGAANTWGGQNPGMTIKNMENVVTWPNGNTLKSLAGWKDAVKFNEFSMFTRLTSPNKNEVFRGMPKLEEIDCTNLTKITYRFFYECPYLCKVAPNENNELPNLTTISGSEAFVRCDALETISIPNLTDTTLPQSTFYQCYHLKNVNIDGINLNTIDNYCFYYDNELESVTGLSHITKLNNEVFRHCTSLRNVDNINNIKYFGGQCFYECGALNLDSIDLHDAEYIYGSAFSYTGIKTANLQHIVYLTNGLRNCSALQTVTFGDHYTDYTITSGAFYDDVSLETINLDNCIEIQSEAFRNCNSLRSVGNTSNLLRFGGSANFLNCYALESINLVNIRQIPSSCFEHCRNLTTIGDISNVERIDAWAFNDSGLTGTIELTNVEILGKCAFRQCPNLETLDLCNITAINDTNPSENYRDCTSLTTFNAPKLKTIYGYDFYNCTSLTTVNIPECTTINDWAFSSCPSLKTINLPKVTTITTGFRGSSLINVSAPVLRSLGNESFRDVQTLKTALFESVETIGYYAFYNCNHLETISPMHNVTSIAYDAFEYCTLLESDIDLPIVESIGRWAFNGCKNIKHVILSNKLKIIEPGVFQTCENLLDITNTNAWESVSRSALRDCKRITSLDLSNLKTIVTDSDRSEGFQFAGMTMLETVTSLENLESISGNDAFYNCIALRTAPLSTKITVIPSYTFEACRSLENIGDISAVTKIDVKGFYNTNNLNYTGNLSSVEYLGEYAFANSGIGPNINLANWSSYNEKSSNHRYFQACPNIVTVNIPSLNIIPTATFEGCTRLESVTFSENLIEVGYYAFKSCLKLNNVVLPATVTTLRNECFNSCTSLKTMTVKATTPPECPNGNPFAGTTFNVIYVPAESIDAYKTATHWSNHASKYQAIPS